jgi:hypothetical protein
MKRLVEQFDSSDPDEAYLAALLQNVHPFEPSAEQTERVLSTLERSPNRRPRGRLRGPVIAGLVLCGATVASATMQQVWKQLRPGSIAAPVEATATPNLAPLRVPPAPQVPLVAPLETPTDVTTRAETQAPHPGAAVRPSMPSKARQPVAEAVDSLGSGVLMVQAIRERRAGNLARARDLATEYRAQNPAGALHEEALALCVEAAAALGDEDARRLAALYLQHYPHGAFRAQAKRVVDSAR